MQQLIYTSAPQGLRPGTRGFTTVAATKGMSPPLMDRLEALSGYQRPVNAAADDVDSPVSHACQRIRVGDKSFTVLSRRAATSNDYSGRSNTIAHHLVLAPDELPPAGPAWLLAQPGLFVDSWAGEPRYLPEAGRLPQVDPAIQPCKLWQRYAGDAGWAGVLSEAFNRGDAQPIVVVYEPGTDVLGLMREAIAILPPGRRWTASFDTYFTTAVAGVSCMCRCMPPDSPLARQARAYPGSLVIDLTSPLSAPPSSPWVNAARVGAIMKPQTPPTPTRRTDKPATITTPAATSAPFEVPMPSDYSLADTTEASWSSSERGGSATRRPPQLAQAQTAPPQKVRVALMGMVALLLLAAGVVLGMYIAPQMTEVQPQLAADLRAKDNQGEAQNPTERQQQSQVKTPDESTDGKTPANANPLAAYPQAPDSDEKGELSAKARNRYGNGAEQPLQSHAGFQGSDASNESESDGGSSATSAGKTIGESSAEGDDAVAGNGGKRFKVDVSDDLPHDVEYKLIEFDPNKSEQDNVYEANGTTGDVVVFKINLADVGKNPDDRMKFKVESGAPSSNKVTISMIVDDPTSPVRMLVVTFTRHGTSTRIEPKFSDTYTNGSLSVAVKLQGQESESYYAIYPPAQKVDLAPKVIKGRNESKVTLVAVPDSIVYEVENSTPEKIPDNPPTTSDDKHVTQFKDKIATIEVNSAVLKFTKNGTEVTVSATDKNIEKDLKSDERTSIEKSLKETINAMQPIVFRDQFKIPIAEVKLRYTR